ncbi:MAG TPA: DNA polymerase III subunit alpha, partial [Planctomycetota bacterium]|nr:DNA polymerase III subunit alpha [Planctomycetota bacterium]
MASSYAPLHLRSNYSLVTGTATVEEILQRAAQLKLPAVALTDTNNLYGAIPFYKRARDLGIKPIIGAEISSVYSLSPPGERARVRGRRPKDNTPPPNPLPQGEGGTKTTRAPGSVVLLARDLAGYANLCRIITRRNLNDTFDLVETIAHFQEGLFILTEDIALAEALADVVDRNSLWMEVAAPGRNWMTWRKLAECARRLGIGVVATGDVYFLDKHDHEFHRTLVAIRENCLVAELGASWGPRPMRGDGKSRTAGQASRGTSPMNPLSPQVRRTERGTRRTSCPRRGGVPDVPIASGRPGHPSEGSRPVTGGPVPDEVGARVVRKHDETDPWRRPGHPDKPGAGKGPGLPEGERLARSTVAHPDSTLMTPEEMVARFRDHPEALANTLRIAEACTLEIPMGKPVFPKYPLPEGETPYSYLYKRCLEGLAWRYKPISQAAAERLTYELSLIDRLGFSEYFVIVGDILRHARQRGIPSVGRGSGASSIVAYLLGITNVDPIRYDLPFERFLNPGRTDCPDLDIDLCWRKRDEVIRYVYDTYGADHVAMISTHNCFRRRSAFREVAKAHGIANDVVNRISKRMSGATAREAVREITSGASDLDVDDETLRKVTRYAERLEGFPHHLSIHCGGIVISDETIDSYVPLEEAAKGIAITQYEMHAIEDVGLVKIDLLGNRALSTLRETVEILKAHEGIRIDPEALPEDDGETFALVQSGRTLGCCQLESPAMRHLLLMLKPHTIRRIIQALALIRPAPASCGMKEAFVRRARGLEETTFPHPSLADVLGDTFGIMLYEDDAMLIAARLAGLDLAEGDRLRKAIKKSRTDEEMRRVARYFLKHATRNGVPPDVASEMWVQMAKFNEYSFCRAHAAGYGLVAYQSAYLKAHHPAAYMTAALNNVQGIYPTRVHLWEAKRMGVEVLGPCVNHSDVEFTHEPFHRDGPHLNRDCPYLNEGKIRIGLNRVKGLSQHTMERIIEKRGQSPFLSLRDFMERVRAGLSEIESLILVGAFDFTGKNRPELIWQARAMFGKLKS